jgi:PPP family 3-phenylpropionic acid transporter
VAPSTAPLPSSSSVARPAIVYALLFGAVGAYVPYIALYLGSRGLDLGTVGALIALHAAVSLVAAPSWGAIADGTGDPRAPILAAGLLSAGAAGLLAIAAAPLTLALAIGLLAAAWAGITPMVDSRAVRIVGHRDRFGQARAWGSAAFILAAFAAGAAVSRIGPAGMFLLYAPLLAATGIGAWVLLGRRDEPVPGTGRPGVAFGRAASLARRGLAPSTILGLLRLPRLGLFFVASVAIWSSSAALLGFVSIRIAELGGDATITAATWSIGPVVEIPLMILFPRLARRIGAERLIVIGAFASGLRALASGLATTPEQILAVAIVGGVGFAFTYVGTVTWLAGAVPRSVQATAQGIFTGTAVSIGAIAGSILGGAIGGVLGLPVLFGIAAAGSAVGGVLTWLAIVRRPAASP